MTVTTAKSQDVPLYIDAVGKIVAREVVSIQPQVSGRITHIHFVDGADVKVGTPTVKGAKVVLEIIRDQKGKKVRFTKFDRTDNYRRKLGHRQDQTVVRVKDIVL